MKLQIPSIYRKLHMNSLRSYTICIISGIIALVLIISNAFFYLQTSRTLRDTYQNQMLQQLHNTMVQINEQISLIDSLYTVFMSNNLIYDSLEKNNVENYHTAAVKKQMTYLLITNYVWKENFIDSVSIYAANGSTYRVSSADSDEAAMQCKEIYENADKNYPFLQLVTLESEKNTLYFVRNIFSSNTGESIAAMVIAIDGSAWMKYLGSSLGNGWFIYLYNNHLKLYSLPEQTTLFSQADYLTVSENLQDLNLSAVVVAPKQELQEKLNSSLHTYLLVIIIIIFLALLISYTLSRAITLPITRMIAYVNRIAEGNYDETIPVTEIYEEFNSLANAFNHMLNELNSYHADNLEKQLSLKNAEIQSLSSQINPHFLFNTLNTIAWKAQMSDNPELYQMVISLGELLKMNVLAKSSSSITLRDELKYVKFYIYLQKIRFEDKINVRFDIAPGLQDLQVPCFSIQSLVENAIVHGLEPKKGSGELLVSIQKKEAYIVIYVQDNGVGFREIPILQDIQISSEHPHTHVGLRNLDRRLFLLYGEDARLQISSTPDEVTVVSFRLPDRKETFL